MNLITCRSVLIITHFSFSLKKTQKNRRLPFFFNMFKSPNILFIIMSDQFSKEIPPGSTFQNLHCLTRKNSLHLLSDFRLRWPFQFVDKIKIQLNFTAHPDTPTPRQLFLFLLSNTIRSLESMRLSRKLFLLLKSEPRYGKETTS